MAKKKLALPPDHDIDRITKVEVGEKIRWEEGPGRHEVELEVKPACDLKDHGRWYCVTHGVGFPNQMQKDCHISRYGEHGPQAEHRLVWICFGHGPEVP